MDRTDDRGAPSELPVPLLLLLPPSLTSLTSTAPLLLQEAKGIAKEGGPLLAPPLFEQVSYSMLQRDRVEMEHRRLYPELGLTAFAPLQGGLLTGKYSSDPATWPAEWRRAGGYAAQPCHAITLPLHPPSPRPRG